MGLTEEPGQPGWRIGGVPTEQVPASDLPGCDDGVTLAVQLASVNIGAAIFEPVADVEQPAAQLDIG